MLSRIFSLVLVLFSCLLWTQQPHAKKTQEAAIERVKTLQVSSLERGLPAVTLEFFLKYEGEGQPIQWRTTGCSAPKQNTVVDPALNQATCVEAEVDLKDGRSATIVVSVRVETLKSGAVGVPALFGVTVTDRSGKTRAIGHLSDLPMELHRPLPKSPRDLPLPVGAVS